VLAEQSATPGTSLRILVVEDDAVVRQYLESVLSHLGHTAHASATGRDALAAFDVQPFDLVLTDLTLPDGMSGEQIALQLSRRGAQVPVLVLTGNAGRLQTREGLPEGVTAVLGKPVSLGTLVATLAQFAPAPHLCRSAS
jgi:two-component system, NarL family, capsular synthesis sensor histidine kinase RcsC